MSRNRTLGNLSPDCNDAQEYAAFMRQIETESAAAAAQQAAEEQEVAEDQRERDEFEQLCVSLLATNLSNSGCETLALCFISSCNFCSVCSVRVQRLEALKEAARQRGKKKPETDSPLEEASAAILSVDGPVSVSKDALKQSAKRRKVRTEGDLHVPRFPLGLSHFECHTRSMLACFCRWPLVV